MKKGFTLIELLAVIIIITVLALITIPVVNDMIEKSKENVFKTNLTNIVRSVDLLVFNPDFPNGSRFEGIITETESTYGGNISDLDIKNAAAWQGTWLYEKDTGLVTLTNASNGVYISSITSETSENDYVISLYEEPGEEVVTELPYYPETPTLSAEHIKTFGGSGSEIGRGVAANDLNYAIVGASPSTDYDLDSLNIGGTDGVIAVYDYNNVLLWKDTFGGTLNDYNRDVISVVDGFIVCGDTYSSDGDLDSISNGGRDGFVIKYDFSGNVVWIKTFGGTGSDGFTKLFPAINGFIAVGNSYSTDGIMTGLNNGGGDALIVKYDLDGNVVWKDNYGGSGTDYYNSVTTTSDGYIAAGYGNSSDFDLLGIALGDNDMYVVKYSYDGTIIWQKNYGGTDYDIATSLVVDESGITIAGGSSSIDLDFAGYNNGVADAIILRLDNAGNIIWANNLGGSSSDRFYEIIKLTDGYITVGYSSSTDADFSGLNLGGTDAIIAKYDLSGTLVSNENMGGTGLDEFYDITLATNGYIVIGQSSSNNNDLLGLNKGFIDIFITSKISN